MKYAETTPLSPDTLFSQKLANAYRVASVVLIGLGAVWMGWMALASEWHLVVTNILYVGVGVALWRSVRKPGFRFIAAVAHILLFYVIAQISLLYDIPNEAAPRVTHLYFLSMAFLFYLTFRLTNPVITYVVVLTYLAAFILFSASGVALPFATPLPDAMRVFGAWMHSIVALSIMCACVYIMQSEFAARARLTRQLSTAIADRQFELYLQPQVDANNVVFGAEALIRWNHPRRGLLGPAEFLDASEQVGLMGALGRHVISEACEYLVRWQADPRTAHLTLAVNVSASQFRDPAFVGDLVRMVEKAGIAPQRLELELTETVVVVDPDEVIGKMQELIDFGVRLSLDDFGTGYSALQYLKRMPFSKLKIDSSFVRDLLQDERNEVIVKGIIQLGQELRLAVVAEGVETEQQKLALTRLGCLQFQGYLFGKPMRATDFLDAIAPVARDVAA